MGGASDAIFGAKSKETSESGNNNNTLLTGALSPALGYVSQGGGLMGDMLGVGGAAAQTGALTNFANSGGMQFLRDQGMQGITSSQAAKGMLQSGDTLKEMDKFNNGLASTYLNQYMQNLMGYSKLGLGAAGVLADSGQYSKGSGTGPKQGLLSSLAGNSGLGQAAGAAMMG